MEIKDRCFLLSWKTMKSASSAFLNEYLTDEALITLLEEKSKMPFEFYLKRIIENKHGIVIDDNVADLEEIWVDYQPNNLAWPLMSENLKNIIQENLTGKECIDWIECTINGLGEKRKYYILRFNNKLDVLDYKNTIYANGTDNVIVPCFSLKKISAFNIFHLPEEYNFWKITSSLYVNKNIERIIKSSKITGVEFEEAKVK